MTCSRGRDLSPDEYLNAPCGLGSFLTLFPLLVPKIEDWRNGQLILFTGPTGHSWFLFRSRGLNQATGLV